MKNGLSRSRAWLEMKHKVPDEKVSRNKPISEPAEWKPGGIARISESDNAIACSCGWAKVHPREKVRGDAAQRHLDKRHDGQGLWWM